ncbi:MAG: hypothetical protein QOI73_1394 [Solirubrobacteraceae bacterium]|nr:hypothetical protein [Solirubrobacteraceae bacterium]
MRRSAVHGHSLDSAAQRPAAEPDAHGHVARARVDLETRGLLGCAQQRDWQAVLAQQVRP